MSDAAGVSVVVPCHNYGRFLEDAVHSILRQSRPAEQIVVIDDGSSDCTPAVVERLHTRLPGLVSIRRDAARGAACTFNDGVRASSGELIVILSADDRLSDEYLERTERALLESDAGFAYTGMRYFGAVQAYLPAADFDVTALMRRNMVHGSAMFRRDLFDRVGGWRSDLEGMEDWEFWVNAVEHGYWGVAVEGCWIEYRRHAGASRNTMSKAARLRTHLRVWALHRRTVRLRNLAAWAGGSAVAMLGRRAAGVP